MTELYGVHAVTAALSNPDRAITQLILSQEKTGARLAALQKMADARQIPVMLMSLQAMDKRFPDCVHQGVVAHVAALPVYIEADLTLLLSRAKSPALILILDGITDPHNLGACLRSADAAGVDFVVIPKDNSASITPVVSKVASGAAEFVPLVRVTNLARAMDLLKEAGVWIYGAAEDAAISLYQVDYHTSVALVIGAEGKGLRHLTRERCDGLFSLPMLGSVSSLNASVATGVCLYEAVRQRLTSNPVGLTKK